MEMPPTPRASVEIIVDPHPDTGEPAVRFAYHLMDAEGTSLSVWYSLEEIRDVMARAQAALGALEQVMEQVVRKDDGNGT